MLQPTGEVEQFYVTLSFSNKIHKFKKKKKNEYSLHFERLCRRQVSITQVHNGYRGKKKKKNTIHPGVSRVVFTGVFREKRIL